MGRPIRIQYQGAIYHINSRGNERKLIFREKKNYLRFLANLQKLKEKYNISSRYKVSTIQGMAR